MRMIDRRRMLGGALALGGAALLPMRAALAAEIDTSDLSSMTGNVRPISADERARRIERAQKLMRANGISALLVEPGSSMIYFTGVEWRRSERLTAAVIPAKGEAVIITPFFEAPSIKETLAIPAEVRVWQEDESPIAVVAGALRDRGAATGNIGIEETVRFFASDGLAHLLPQVKMVSANPVVRGCRMIKTPAEIALMQTANDITLAAIKWTWQHTRDGMAPAELSAMIDAATQKLGGKSDGALVLLGESAAYPHGSHKPQRVRDGQVILIDSGCTVQGYSSDISRTWVPGKAPDEVRRVFDTVAAGQQLVMKTAKVGVPAGHIDDVVRGFYTSKGFGPGYKLPGMSHRTGHGIGLDGHEPVNLVHGEMMPLAAGMCFSDEPGLYLPGKFGVRLEDCWHLTDAGPVFFTTPPTDIDHPFG
ncbi:M24 family metallopeptidase [Sphingomonas nostoxanthinifaciens]|uniref:M24 family metallopeptidase n=1 Tax=Sphingomonas nostoxanthinifaciens TaxID=2872652 RepID=UPI001CC21B3B|nr:Xaa-Pro peptidase family protein [Sphingomonas nostoxanthinifaciens]UAK26745.1 Xaa-Pro peptidase family protein [Sphingomonas nostoxanthinifaciens]